MHSLRRWFTLVGAALCAATANTLAQEPALQPVSIDGVPVHPTRLLAKVKAGSGTAAHASALAANDLHAVSSSTLVPGLVVLDVYPVARAASAAPAPAPDPAALAAALEARIATLQASGLYEYVEPDFVFELDAAPNDTAFTDATLWALKNTGQAGGASGVDIDAERAWDVTTGSRSVIVAVIDTGIRYTHQDLATQLWRNPGEIAGNGLDDDHNGIVDDVFGMYAKYSGPNGDPDDTVIGHGTHVAGTIGAAANNGQPHVGVAWQVQLMACRFFDDYGFGQASTAITCIDYAVAHGAKILNCSWGGYGYSRALRDAFAAAGAQGVLTAAASGNNSNSNDFLPSYPASFDLDSIISVAAIDRGGSFAFFSNSGVHSVDLAAPGVDVYSTFNESDSSYVTYSGTSMAAPHVAGAAALVRAQFPGISLLDLRDRLLRTTTSMLALAPLVATGGRLNAYHALADSGDGQLEIVLAPPTGTSAVYGRAVTVTARVSDLVGVTGASVTATTSAGDALQFRDDGVAPDTTANDALYTTTFTMPLAGAQLTLDATATATGKTAATASVSWPLQIAPANDLFTGRAPVPADGGSVTGTNVGATDEAGEPEHAGYAGGASVWWTWTAPVSGKIRLSTLGSSFDTLLAVYTGASVNALTLVSSNNNFYRTRTSLLVFNATAGTTYQIAVDSALSNPETGPVTGAIALTLTISAPPPNDDFAHRIEITGTSAAIDGVTIDATRESAEPLHFWSGSIGSYFSGGSVWWTWTAPASGTAVLAVSDADLDHGVAVYTGTTLAALQRVAIVRYDVGPRHPTFAAIAGTTYQIAVSRLVADFGGPFVLTLTMPPSPANDFFANAAPITGASATVTSHNVNASPENNEPHAFVGRTVWWTWIAPTNGTAMVNTAGSAIPTWLTVYTGTTLAALTEVTYGFVAREGDRTPRAAFSAVAGQTYHFQVDGLVDFTPSGTIVLNVETVAPPANNDFANRLALAGANATFAGTTNGATREPLEPYRIGEPMGNTVWWSWTAPSAGTVTITIPDPGRELHVFAGDALAGLAGITNSNLASDQLRRKVFHASAGATYAILVDGYNGAIGAFTGELALVPGPANDASAEATVLTGAVVTGTSDTAVATFDINEPDYFSDPDRANVWWTWAPPGDGMVEVDTAGSAIDAYLVVQGVELKADHGSGGTFSRAAVRVATGGQCMIQVDGWQGARGAVTINLRYWPKPANDLRANATVITDFSGVISGTNRGAWGVDPDYDIFTEPPDSGFSGVHGGTSVWWRWIALTSGPVAISTAGSTFTPLLAIIRDNGIFVGSSIAEPSRTVVPGIAFMAEAGHNYLLCVDGRDRTMGDLQLRFVSGAPPTITMQPASHSIRFQTGTTLTVAATGTQGPLGYQWFQDSYAILGAREATLVRPTPVSSGNYTCLVFDDVGAVLTAPATLTTALIWIDNLPPPATAGNSITITATTPGFTGVTYQWLFHGVLLPGATARTLTLPSAQAFQRGTYSVILTQAGGNTSTSNAVTLNVNAAAPSNARLLNLSTRGLAQSGDNVLIPGFVVSSSTSSPQGGSTNKRLLIRAVGPTLALDPIGLAGTLVADPQMTLKQYNFTTQAYEDIASNDDWGTNPNAAEITTTAADLSAFELKDAKEAALLVELAPGQYTVFAGDKSGATGLAIVELYDADPAGAGPASTLVNISNRGYAGVGDQVMIPGFVVSSEGPKTLLVRVVGPTLAGAPYNVPGTMADPQLTIYSGQTAILANDNWSDNPDAATTAQVAQQVGAFALAAGSADAAFVVTLAPGVYTVVGASADGAGTGIVLVEVYVVP